MNLDSHSLRELFDAAIALDADARRAFLDRHCADPALRAQLDALLAADQDAAEPLQADGIERIACAIGPAPRHESLPPGSRVGPFELVEVIGEGGSSTVFRAVRDMEGAIQQVALKLMRRGLYSPEAQRLFGREQRALVQLRHPNIARMIEGGVHESGLPYIALELVEGRTITDFARARGLDLRERLRLFSVVCAAVEAAHRALIVHRDLKPSNVLVTEEGEVKLLDFGIAKLLAEEDEESRTQMPAFTPAYAAPEQRDGGPITTATDVYALGVLLGELVTGERINDGSGRTPSSRITAGSADGGMATVVPITRRQVRGDLDAIILKSLDSDPARRYASAGQLADDIERLLARQPVSAQAPSRWYRARKFVQRHKGGVASTVAFLLAILAALGMALWQARVAREQAQIARSESTRANATLAFITDLLQTASAELPKDQRPTPEALVADAANKAREDEDLDPQVRAQLLLTLGEIARINGDNANAERLIDEAIERERSLGIAPSSPDWIAALVSKGNLLHSTNRSREADALMQTLLPHIDAVDSEGAVSALMLYGATRAYLGDSLSAATVARQALEKAQRVFGADSTDGIETATYLGQLCSNLRRYRDSEVILEDTLARWRRLKLPMNEQYARSQLHLAVSKQRLGKFDEVEPLYRESIALLRSIQAGPFHRISQGLRGYALFLIEMERFDEARSLLEEALANDLAVYGTDHVATATTRDAFGILQAARQELAAAEISTRAALDVLQRHAKLAGYERELARTRVHLAGIVNALGRTEEAAAIQVQAMAEQTDTADVPSVELAEAVRVSGEIATSQRDFAAALDHSDRALAVLAALDLPSPDVEIPTRALRAKALLALQRIDDARAEIQLASKRQNESNPRAKTKLAQLLAIHTRIERASGDSKAEEDAIQRAHALGVTHEWLKPEDRESLRFD
ncbi:MAG TPA: serine/threonine-protein kinase [Dokdonella sp.]|nr:serine/threonine-protein kinase [Dokdonella sp.]